MPFFIPLCHTPPIWVEAGRLKIHVVPLPAGNSLTFLASIFNSWTVPLKLVPQLLNIPSGLPLLFINFCYLLMKLSVSRPSTTSKWIAWVVKQINKVPWHFSLACLCFIYIGPNKSISVLQNDVFIAYNLWSRRSLIFGSKFLVFINLCYLLMKLSVSRPSTTSKWIAQVVKQVNIAPWHFSLAHLCFTHTRTHYIYIYIGPNKSICVLQNGVFIASNLWSRRSLIFGSKFSAHFLWLVMLFLIICFTKTSSHHPTFLLQIS